MQPSLREVFKGIDFDSHERTNTSFPLGTVLMVNSKFGNHGHTVGKPVLVYRYSIPDERNKVFMHAIDDRGVTGKGLYVYGVDLFQAYEPNASAVADWVEGVKDNGLENHPSILQAYRRICLGEKQ
jgi:hypothetical protein